MNPLPAPGVHLNVPEKTYRQWDAPSQSILKAGETALDMYAALTRPKPPTRQQIVGTALHWAFFEPGRFAERCINEPTVNKRKPSEREDLAKWYADNADKLVLQGEESAQIKAWSEALREHPGADYLLNLPGESEVSLLWQDKETGENVKARIDRLPHDGPIQDLKTCAAITDKALDYAISDHGYHFQAACYTEGVEAVGRGSRDYVLTWLLKEYPYHVRTRPLERDWILAGQMQYRKALRIYSEARKSGVWSGYSDKLEPHYAPSWIIRQLGNIDMEFKQ